MDVEIILDFLYEKKIKKKKDFWQIQSKSKYMLYF